MLDTELKKEINEILSSTNKDFKLWFRCDDIAVASKKFVKMNSIFKKYDTKCYYAVIPNLIEDSVIKEINSNPNIFVMQHGISHKNNGTNVALELIDNKHIIDECIEKITFMKDAFGNKFNNILCPPWNKIEQGAEKILSNFYDGLSTYFCNESCFKFDLNPNIDIIDWTTGNYKGHKFIVEKMKARLYTNYIGFCLHHNHMNDDAFDFIEYIVSNFNDKINLSFRI